VWADHANLISTAYSGTGALKTDYTRTGKRGKLGLLEDGINSVMRYLKNNYFDGPRQVSRAEIVTRKRRLGRVVADADLRLQIGRIRPIYWIMDASAGYVIGDDVANR
jgi:hypothetical protein